MKLSDKILLTAIIKLAQSMNPEVLAEGVETRGQLEFLISQQCDKIQGYFFKACAERRVHAALEEKQRRLKG